MIRGPPFTFRQLENSCCLSRNEVMRQNNASIGKLQCIMMPVRIAGIDVTETSNVRVNPAGNNSKMAIGHIGFERQFRSWKQTDRDIGLLRRRKASCRGCAEFGGYELVIHRRRARCHCMEAVIAHDGLPFCTAYCAAQTRFLAALLIFQLQLRRTMIGSESPSILNTLTFVEDQSDR